VEMDIDHIKKKRNMSRFDDEDAFFDKMNLEQSPINIESNVVVEISVEPICFFDENVFAVRVRVNKLQHLLKLFASRLFCHALSLLVLS
jgi:hypothetical protein